MSKKISFKEYSGKYHANDYESLRGITLKDINCTSLESMKAIDMIKKVKETLGSSNLKESRNQAMNTNLSKDVSVNGNEYVQENKDIDVQDSKTEPVINDESININENVNIDVNMLIAKAKKTKQPKAETYRDTHVQRTFWVEKDVMKLVDALCTNKGDKAKFVSAALLEHAKKILSEE